MTNLANTLNMVLHSQRQQMMRIWLTKNYWLKETNKLIMSGTMCHLSCIIPTAPRQFLIIQARLLMLIWMDINIILEGIKEVMSTTLILNKFILKIQTLTKVLVLFPVQISHSILNNNTTLCMVIKIINLFIKIASESDKIMFILKAQLHLIFLIIIWH